MDLSAVIFVAVAIAWAVYLVPKALRHHDEARRSRSVDRFSRTVRVLARRDAVSARDARLVVPPRARRATAETAPAEPRVEQHQPEPAASTPTTEEERRGRRTSARRATRRRRRVLGLLLAATAVVATLVAVGVVAAPWLAAPVGLLVAWLAACRVMVRGEHASWDAITAPAETDPTSGPAEPVASETGENARPDDPGYDLSDDLSGEPSDDKVTSTADTTGLAPVAVRDALWDPVPVTLPTYVHKATAVRRTVRTIDLDATGVWTSGRTDEDVCGCSERLLAAVRMARLIRG